MRAKAEGGGVRKGDTAGDVDALAFEPGLQSSRPAPPHIEKRKRKTKGLEITFDPAARRKYLTEFHERKVERRNHANKKRAEHERRLKLEERAKKRAKLREDLRLDEYETSSESEADKAGETLEAGDARVYSADGLITTVITTSIALNSDEEAEDELEEEEGATASGDDGEGLEATEEQTPPSRRKTEGMTGRKGKRKGVCSGSSKIQAARSKGVRKKRRHKK